MRMIVALGLVCIMVLGLIGCAPANTSVSVNVENSDNLSSGKFGKSAMVEIGDFLWYDSTTRIVYWWNGNLYASASYTTNPSPYYAPNGLPYRYNPETNTFEEIDMYDYARS
jgi:hypothetical protein